MCGLRTITSWTGETGDTWRAVRVAQVQISKRHVRAMCAQSEGVRHLDGERVQARCVAATTALPHSSRVGRALLLPERHLGWGEGTPSVAHVPSGAVLTQWRVPAVEAISTSTMAVLRAYKSPESRGDGKGGVDQPVQGP